MAEPEITLPRPSFFRTLFFVALAAAFLVAADSVLANTERAETSLEAARFYREGESLMKQHRYVEAADSFRSAIANARRNTDYPLALGEALLEADQLVEANSTLGDLLQTDSMAGAPNLTMARVFAKEGQFEQATFYYHRAIYGQWKQDADANRIRVRFELAELLAKRNSKAELLAELLPLQEEAATDAGTQTRLAQLYMIAGSPARAAAIYREIVRASPQDSAARRGLGDAEFALGDYLAARSAYVSSGPAENRKALDLIDEVLNLDPMSRGLSGAERYRRSVRVLQLAIDRVSSCISQSARPLLDAAGADVARRVAAGGQSEATEANLDAAEKLWQAAKAECRPAPAASDSTQNDPLQLVLAKSVQSEH
jgi:tetratricopeptide (TPR) repeat protein